MELEFRWERLEGMKKVSRIIKKGIGYDQSRKYLRRIVGERLYDDGREISACQNSKDEGPCGLQSLIFEFRSGKWLLVTTHFCECE